MSRSFRTMMLVLGLSVSWSTACPAVSLNFLIDNDFFTRDPVRGTRWLDLTNSTNMSYNQVITSTGPGGLFDGWRHATEAEVHDMLGHGGVFNYPFFNAVVSQQTFDAIEEVFGLLGVTAVNNQGFFLQQVSNGITSDFNPVFQARVGLAIGTVDYVSDEIDDLATYSGWTIDSATASAGAGHFLINTGAPADGEAEQAPLMPTSTGPNGEKMFDNAAGDGFWWDPPANDMIVATDGNSLLTVIGMPMDYPDTDGLYTITDDVNGSITLAAGEFYQLPTPVSEFTISDIELSPEEGEPVFAAFLQFDQPIVNFSITPVPEPGSWGIIGLVFLVGTRWRRRGGETT